MFYNRTILGAVDDVIEFSKFTIVERRQLPEQLSADPGPSAGRFPTDPLLVNGPFVNRAAARTSCSRREHRARTRAS